MTVDAPSPRAVRGARPEMTPAQVPTWIRALLTGTLYLVAARYTLVINDAGDLDSAYWPGAGVALAAVMLSPRRMWPAILGTVGLVELLNSLSYGAGWFPAACWALANTVTPAAVAATLRRVDGEGFGDVGRTVRFIVTVLTVPVLGALVGAVGARAGGVESSYLVTVARWSIGDSVGMLAVAPFLVLIADREVRARLRCPEAALILAMVILGTVAAFWDWGAAAALPLLFLALPAMIWAAVRFCSAGAAAAIFVVAQLAHLGTAANLGAIAEAVSRTDGAIWLLQLYLVTLATTALILGSRSNESDVNRQLAAERQRLISVVSHEFRTPLTPILGFSALSLERHPDLPDDVRDALIMIQRNGEHLLELVNALLTVSRARHGRLVATPQATDLQGLIAEVLDELDLDVVAPTVTTPAIAWVDPGQLRQVLANLLTNARRHGRPPIGVELGATATELSIVVSDHGDGVPPGFVPQLFQDFSQAAGGDDRPVPGLGLGLAITHDLVTANNGRIRYERGEPDGARFVVTVPRDLSHHTVRP
jgi:signal transduction histidine kinase